MPPNQSIGRQRQKNPHFTKLCKWQTKCTVSVSQTYSVGSYTTAKHTWSVVISCSISCNLPRWWQLFRRTKTSSSNRRPSNDCTWQKQERLQWLLHSCVPTAVMQANIQNQTLSVTFSFSFVIVSPVTRWNCLTFFTAKTMVTGQFARCGEKLRRQWQPGSQPRNAEIWQQQTTCAGIHSPSQATHK